MLCDAVVRTTAEAARRADEPLEEKVVIAVSTIMTWRKTKPPKGSTEIPESRYKRRRADAAFEDIKVCARCTNTHQGEVAFHSTPFHSLLCLSNGCPNDR